jgi:SAM-dependent methyltransferase
LKIPLRGLAAFFGVGLVTRSKTELAMDQGTPTRPDYPADAFAGTAPFYLRHRVPYPASLLGDLLDRATINGGGRLLDLACGPGRLTFALASSFRKVWAVDLEPEMIADAKREASERGVKNVTWSVGKVEELEAPPKSFEFVSIGEAFHRLNQPVAASKSFDCLVRGGCIAILGSYGMLSRREPWHNIVVNMVEKWTKRSLGGADPSNPSPFGSPKHCEHVLGDAGFADVASYRFLEAHTWTIDSIVGFLYSTSVSSRKVLGANVVDFEWELRSALLAFDPGGSYRETTQWGYTFGRKKI